MFFVISLQNARGTRLYLRQALRRTVCRHARYHARYVRIILLAHIPGGWAEL